MAGWGTSVAAVDILEQIREIQETLDLYTQQLEEDAQTVFAEYFNADFKRGDLVVFPEHRKASYEYLQRILTDTMLSQVKLDRMNLVSKITVLQGEI